MNIIIVLLVFVIYLLSSQMNSKKREQMNRTFHTKVGWWYWIVIVVTSSGMFYFFWIHSVLLTLLLALVVVFEIEMLIHTQYVVTTDNRLRIETGRFVRKMNLDIEDIVGIRKVRSMAFFSAALSFRRLEIAFRTNDGNVNVLTVSPKNEDDFVRLLLKRNPKIIVNTNI